MIRRETEAQEKQSQQPDPIANIDGVFDDTQPDADPAKGTETPPSSTRPRRSSRRSLSRGSRPSHASPAPTTDRSRSRRRTVSVTDRGQAGAPPLINRPPPLPTLQSQNIHTETEPETEQNEHVLITPASTADQAHAQTNSLNAPPFLPKFKTSSHLHSESRDDAMSTRTGYSALSTSGASTRAVFSAAGISKPAQPQSTGDVSACASESTQNGVVAGFDGEPNPNMDVEPRVEREMQREREREGFDTPVSRRSLERLQTAAEEALVENPDRHDADVDPVTDARARAALSPASPLRSPSSTAVVNAEGVLRQ
jgi:hypothetical protein